MDEIEKRLRMRRKAIHNAEAKLLGEMEATRMVLNGVADQLPPHVAWFLNDKIHAFYKPSFDALQTERDFIEKMLGEV